jgi:hypothetical protein
MDTFKAATPEEMAALGMGDTPAATGTDAWPSLAANKDRLPPYGWIQWKGTDVCMDVHCSCGGTMHVDADFLYYLQCPYCGQVYEVGGHVTLSPVDPAQVRGNIHLLDRDDD